MKPQYQDIIVMGPNQYSSVGHIAIVVSANDENIIIAQQNVSNQFNQDLSLMKTKKGDKHCYTISGKDETLHVLGWMRR